MIKTCIFVIANRKGGVGKSTCVAHLALEAAKEKKQILLIDLDPQKTLDKWWVKRTENNPQMLETQPGKLKETIKKFKNNKFHYIFIDTPAGTSDTVWEAIEISDWVIIPSKPTGPDLNALGDILQIVKELKKKFLFIITQAIPTAKNTLDATTVLAGFGTVAPNPIFHRISYTQAMLSGNSAAEMNNNAKKELSSIWKFIINNINKEEENGKRRLEV